MEQACNVNNPYLNAPYLAGLSYNGTLNEFPTLMQQLAAFLLARGPYAYLGWGEWGMVWPENVPFPKQVWDLDVGIPLDTVCEPSPHASYVFQRRYSKVSVQLDCKAWKATIQTV